MVFMATIAANIGINMASFGEFCAVAPEGVLEDVLTHTSELKREEIRTEVKNIP